MNHRTSRQNAGFTLIELLVVVAVIGILISVLLPALQAARSAGQKIVGASTQRQLALAQIQYATENDNYYAGPNDPTQIFAAAQIVPGADVGGTFQPDTRIAFNTNSTTPTSRYDWISPILGNAFEFSANRAERTAQIFNQLACPTTSVPSTLFGSAPDRSDFEVVLDETGFNQISYMSPGNFHWLSSNAPSLSEAPRGVRELKRNGVGRARRIVGFSTPIPSPRNFLPRIDRIKGSSYKVLVTDATRFLDGDGVLDFDINTDPTAGSSPRYGSFTTNTPIWSGSPRAWLRPGHPDYTGQDNLSIRHESNNAINVSYFDGSTGTLRRADIYGQPKHWHPRGSEFTGNSVSPESQAIYEPGDSVD